MGIGEANSHVEYPHGYGEDGQRRSHHSLKIDDCKSVAMRWPIGKYRITAASRITFENMFFVPLGLGGGGVATFSTVADDSLKVTEDKVHRDWGRATWGGEASSSGQHVRMERYRQSDSTVATTVALPQRHLLGPRLTWTNQLVAPSGYWSSTVGRRRDCLSSSSPHNTWPRRAVFKFEWKCRARVRVQDGQRFISVWNLPHPIENNVNIRATKEECLPKQK